MKTKDLDKVTLEELYGFVEDDGSFDDELEFDEWDGEYNNPTELDEGVDVPMYVANTYLRNWKSSGRIVINRGGTRSSKTYSLVQMISNWLYTGWIRENEYLEEGVCNIVRKNKSTIRVTVLKDFEEVISMNPLYSEIKINNTNKTFEYEGRLVQFFGADEEQKIRGLKSDILYCNEANELAYKKQFFQLLIRCTGTIFIDFNPSDPDVWINTELEQKRAAKKKDVEVIVTTYLDNPFLERTQIEEIKGIRDIDEELWQVYGLGNYGKITGLIYNIKEVDFLPDGAEFLGFGLDFGFTNDPTALIQMWYFDGGIYMRDLIYKTGLTTPMLAEKMKKIGVPMDAPIFADGAEPKTCTELRALGFSGVRNVKGNDKKILFGISVMNSHDLYHLSDSLAIKSEGMKYKWLEDKETGEPTNKPIDGFNHALDAARYVAVKKLANRMNRAIYKYYNSINYK